MLVIKQWAEDVKVWGILIIKKWAEEVKTWLPGCLPHDPGYCNMKYNLAELWEVKGHLWAILRTQSVFQLHLTFE